MWTEAELPDDDLESVYGREALYMRLLATVARLEKKYGVLGEEPEQNNA